MPLLREFDLDLPAEPKLRRQFRTQTRCITAFYERLFVPFQTVGCWKVLVECVDRVEKPGVRDLLGAFTVQVEVPIARFFSMSEGEKRRFSLKYLTAGIELVVADQGWPTGPFVDAHNAIVALQYVNEWVWKKPVGSPSGARLAHVVCIHNVESMDIFVVVSSRDGSEVFRERAISELPDEFAYSKHLGKLMWLGEDRVALVNKRGDGRVELPVEVYMGARPNATIVS